MSLHDVPSQLVMQSLHVDLVIAEQVHLLPQLLYLLLREVLRYDFPGP